MESLFSAQPTQRGQAFRGTGAVDHTSRGDRHEGQAEAAGRAAGLERGRSQGAPVDFSHVRVHADDEADVAATGAGAAAYTVGNHITFRRGQFQPSAPRGRQLLAHELAHVVQQGGGGQGPGGVELSPTDGPQVQKQDWADWVAGPVLSLASPGLSNVAQAWLADPANRQFLDDLEASVRESPQHIREILLGEVWDAIKAHWGKVLAVTIGLLVTEGVIAVLTGAPEPTLLTKVVAVILQLLVIAILGYFAAVELKGVYEEGRNWFRLAHAAKGDPAKITEASKSFLRMVRHIILAILVLAGVRARIRGFTVPEGAASVAGGGLEGGGGQVVDIASHPDYQPRFSSPGDTGAAAGTTAGPAFGPGGTAYDLRPAPVVQPQPPPPVQLPVRVSPVGTAPTSGVGIQPGPIVGAGVATATQGKDKDEPKPVVMLNAFGNRTQPRDPRPSDTPVDSAGYVGPTLPPTGASTFADVSFAPLTGHYHRVPRDTVPLTPGLGVIADGSDVGGTAPPTHHTIFPLVRMLFTDFVSKFQKLPWTYGGKK